MSSAVTTSRLVIPGVATSSTAATTSSPAVVAPTTSRAATTTQAVVAPSTSAAAVPSTTVAAAPTTSASSAASVSRSATSAAASSVAPLTTTATSSIAPSTSTSSSTSTPPPSSSSSPTSSSSSRATSTTAVVGYAEPASGSGSSSTMSGAMIGAIAGGVAGLLLLLVLAFFGIRRYRGRNRVPPPPPRDMEVAFHPGNARSRAFSGGMVESGLARGPSTSINRENSFAALLQSQPSAQVSRQPSYYATYPVATPSTLGGSPPDTSPDFYPVAEPPALVNTGLPSAAMGDMTPGTPGRSITPTPAQHSGPGVPVPLAPPMLAAGASSESGPPSPKANRRVTSVDRLRMEAGVATASPTPASAGPDPAPSAPPATQFPVAHPYPSHSDSGHSSAGGSRTPPSPAHSRSMSPMPSAYGSGSPSLGGRPGSMSSLSGRNYLHVGPARGAPHQGRPVNLEMPRLLGSPELNSGGSQLGSPMSPGGEWGPRGMSAGQSPVDFLPNPHGHRRVSSNQSIPSLASPPSLRSGGRQQFASAPLGLSSIQQGQGYGEGGQGAGAQPRRAP